MIFKITALIIIALLLTADYALLVIASREEQRAERMYRRWKSENGEREGEMKEVIVRYTDGIGYENVLGEVVGELVRCKECKWYKQSEAFCENGNGLWQAGDDCFCSYGERSEP